jgi:hypothetical protein
MPAYDFTLTENHNTASISVMRQLGMQIGRNTRGEPPWLQTVGVLPNPALA